jgi:hypothetical protein
VLDVFGTAPSSITVILQGLTIRNGITGEPSGGGISNVARPGTGNVTLIHTTLNRNVAGSGGGGISLQADGQGQRSVLNITDSAIQRNITESTWASVPGSWVVQQLPLAPAQGGPRGPYTGRRPAAAERLRPRLQPTHLPALRPAGCRCRGASHWGRRGV